MPDWNALIAKAESVAAEAEDAERSARYAVEQCRDLVSALEAARDDEEAK